MPPRATAERTDSAGVELVVSAEPWWRSGEAWTLAPEPGLRIGSLEGGDGDDFVRIRGALLLADGGILVGDDGADELRLFSSAGDFVRRVAGRGEGPGELESVRLLYRSRADSIYLFDWSGRRYSVFDPALAFARSARVETRVPGITLPHVKAFTASGTPVLMGARPPWVEEPLEHYGQPQHLLLQDSTGRFDREIARVTGKGYYETLYASREERILVLSTGDFDVRELDLEGRLRRRIRRSYDAPPIPPGFFEQLVTPFGPAESDAVVTLHAEDGRAIRTTPTTRDPADYPATLPAADRLLVDRQDHLWLRHGQWPDTLPQTWSVFDPTGQWLGEIAVPGGLELLDVDGDRVLARSRDELGVESVVVLRLEGRGGPG